MIDTSATSPTRRDVRTGDDTGIDASSSAA